MELSTILVFVAVLACPIAMGVMMWMMNKNMSGDSHQSMSGTDADRLNVLRDRRRMLDQEIAEVQKISELEEQKKGLARVATAESPSDNQTQPG